MDARRFAALVRHLTHGKDRRQVLGQLLGSFAFVGPVLRPGGAAARKRRKNRRKKRRGDRSEPSDCARACGSSCLYCVNVTPDPIVICGDATSTVCNRPCSSGVDCLGTGFAWCIGTLEEVETGRVFSPCETPGGHCGDVSACIV